MDATRRAMEKRDKAIVVATNTTSTIRSSLARATDVRRYHAHAHGTATGTTHAVGCRVLRTRVALISTLESAGHKHAFAANTVAGRALSSRCTGSGITRVGLSRKMNTASCHSHCHQLLHMSSNGARILQ